MFPTQGDFEALLQQLREEGTESPCVDGKGDLPLETAGDRAYLIRHVAAMANNVECSYLIIGVEDQTWNSVGLPAGSALLDPDETQRHLNQALENRLDPNVSVRYRTYEVNGVPHGLIMVEGTSAPYITAIPNQRYGSKRTRGGQEHIYRGAIYVRRGANSVIANRQSEVLAIVSRVQQIGARHAQPDEFLTRWNYGDVDSEGFGRHTLSERLVEAHTHRSSSYPTIEWVPAKSWISFVFSPVSGNCQLDTVALEDKLKPGQRIGRGAEWYRGLPKAFRHALFRPRATPREFTAWWPTSNQNDGEVTHFIRILPSGHVEIGCGYPGFLERDGTRFFSFVYLIGCLWQMIYLSKEIYDDAHFSGETAVLVNLVGTNETFLGDPARSQGDGGLLIIGMRLTGSQQDVYDGMNIQIERRLPLARASDDDIRDFVRDVAREIGNYYGQDHPSCFDYPTEDFPHKQYEDLI